MKVAIAANKVGQELKDCVKAYLTKKGYEMVDLSDDDIFTATTNVVRAIQEQGITREEAEQQFLKGHSFLRAAFSL